MTKSGLYTECFAKENVELPKGYFFGVSAETGGLAGMCMRLCSSALCCLCMCGAKETKQH